MAAYEAETTRFGIMETSHIEGIVHQDSLCELRAKHVTYLGPPCLTLC